jgi:molybdate transport repressor ModE-like protein
MNPDRWSALAIRHLVAFDAVAREGSFRGAAERLGYTQSAVSQQIQGLERVVGQRLVERAAGRRAVGLTEAGELLLVHAQQILARTQEAHADLLALAHGAAGTLRVGIYQSAGARILPRVMARYAAAWPRVRVRLTESGSGYELLRFVEQGDLDLTFASLPIVEGGPFESVELTEDEYVLLVPAGSPLADGRRPTLPEICEHPLIAWRATAPGRGIEARLHERGLNPEIVFRSDDSGTVQGLVGAGVGVAIVTRLTVGEDDPLVAVVELGDQLPHRSVGIAWHRDRYQSAAARGFVEVARSSAGGRSLVDASAARVT